MKNLLLIIILLCSTPLFSQNCFRLVKYSKNLIKPSKSLLTIQRITIVEENQLKNIVQALEVKSRYKNTKEMSIEYMTDTKNIPVGFIDSRIEQFACNPTKTYGTYNYLRVCSKNLNIDEWKKVKKSIGYNGIHHIINTSTIKQLYNKSLLSYENKTINLYPFLEDMIQNAPAMIHPYHNIPEYTKIFHNSDIQLSLYDKSGIKAILDDYFNKIKMLNKQAGFEELDENMINGIYLESKLWSDYYGLKWK